jgi:hypothetical protein
MWRAVLEDVRGMLEDRSFERFGALAFGSSTCWLFASGCLWAFKRYVITSLSSFPLSLHFQRSDYTNCKCRTCPTVQVKHFQRYDQPNFAMCHN